MAISIPKVETPNHIESLDGIPGKALIENAAVGSDLEHELSPWMAVKAYPMAVFWCLMVSMCVVMVRSILNNHG